MGFEAKIDDITYRPSLWETDDNYHYIVKTPLLENCRNGACQGLNDLFRLTNIPAAQAEFLFNQRSIQHRAMISYHPLFSWALGALHHAGLSYENSLKILYLAGQALLAASVAALALLWVGPRAGGVANLLMLSPWLTPGMIIMKPATLSGAFIVFAWAVLPTRWRWRFPVAILLLAIASSVHIAAAVATLLTALIVWLAESRYFPLRLPKHEELSPLMFMGACAIIAALALSYDGNLAPQRLNPVYAYAAGGLADLIKGNLYQLHLLLESIQNKGGLVFLLLPLFLIPWSLRAGKVRNYALAVFATLPLLLVASLVYPSPEATFLERVLPPILVAISVMLAALITRCVADFHYIHVCEWWKGKASALHTGLTCALLAGTFYMVAVNLGTTAVAVSFIRTNKNITLDTAVIETSLSQRATHEKLLIPLRAPFGQAVPNELEESVIYFALAHGAAAKGLAISPFTFWPQSGVSPSEVTQILALNPIVTASNNDLLLQPGDEITLSAPQGKNGSLFIIVPAGKVVLQMHKGKISVTGPYRGWINLAEPEVKLKVTQTHGGARILGWKIDERQTTFWPWNTSARLSWGHGVYATTFDLQNLLQHEKTPCTVNNVLDDSTSLVLARLTCKEELPQ